MLPKVDTGRVILECRFPVPANDSVETLKLRTMTTMLAMFHWIAATIARGERLPVAAKHWTRKPYTFKEMEALKVIEPTMPECEVGRRLRATVYPVYPGYPGPVRRDPDGRQFPFPVNMQ
jgi:methionyl-tRNA formyltransferase